MGQYTIGTGVNAFTITYLDTDIPVQGSNEYGTPDAKNNPVCAFSVDAFNCFYTAGQDTSPDHITANDTPINWHYTSGSLWTFDYTSKPADDSFFANTVLTYHDTNAPHVITGVTDLQRLVWNVPITETSETVTLYGASSPTAIKTYQINAFDNNANVDVYNPNDTEYNTPIGTIRINPFTISPTNRNALQSYIPCSDRENDKVTWYGNDVVRWDGTRVSGNLNSSRYRPQFATLDNLPSGNDQNVWIYDSTGKYIMHMAYSSQNYSGCTCMYYCASLDEILFLAACNGLKFRYGGVVYKPIVSGGIVTGYTDNMAFTSEFDDWHTINDHVVPLSPPVIATGDREKDMNVSDHVSISGFVKYYIIDRAKADAISDCISRVDILSIGKDYTNNLISYKLFPLTGYTEGTARTITIGGKDMEYANGDKITGVPVTGVLPKTITGIKIPETFHDFRDYAPFTKIEIFVPFCGWAQLPPWCMGKKISGMMFFDLANGTVKAVIKASQTVVAEMGGVCAIDVPFTSTANGVKAGHMLANMASGMSSAFNPTPQNLLSANVGILTAFNANFTQTKGVMGDGSNIDGLTDVWIKVTRPAIGDLANVPAQYKHDVGVPCGKQLTLSSGDGYTQVLDANITGAMTDREKQMIVDGFKHGLIL